MKKVIIFIFLVIAINGYTSEKISSLINPEDSSLFNKKNIDFNTFKMSFYYLRYNLLNKANFYNTDSISKINSKGFVTTGIILTSIGTAVLAGGGVLIGLSYYFAWISLSWILETTNFTVKDWNIVWDVMFLSADKYPRSALAVSSLLAGINLAVAGFMFVPGIIYLIIGLISKKKLSAYNIAPLSNAFGVSIKLQI